MKKPIIQKEASLLDATGLRRKYQGIAGNANDIIIPSDKLIWIPSRCLPLNHQLGGGQPQGSIMEIFGPESSGKSLIAVDFSYVTQYLGGKVLWGDIEMCYMHSWMQQNGLDSSEVDVFQDTTIELLSDWSKDSIRYYRSKLVHNEPITLVVDSLAALKCQSDLDADQSNGKAEMGNRAKAIYSWLRSRNALYKRYGVNVICINQLRDKVGAGMYEDPNTTPGGSAMKFYASQRLQIVRGKRLTDTKNQPYGQVDYVHCKKNKVAPPQERFETEVYFKEKAHGYIGFSKYKGLAQIFLSEKVIKKVGNSFEFKGNKIARGKDHLEEVIEQDAELRAKLLSKTNINTVSKTEAKLASITTNLYPVKTKKSKGDE